jgi:hypothetical protein
LLSLEAVHKMVTLPNTIGRQKAQAKYNAKPEQKKRRAQRNKTRRKLIREGRVRVGDGKDIDHKNHNTADMSSQNLQVQDKHVNRRDGGPMARMLLRPGKRKKKK